MSHSDPPQEGRRRFQSTHWTVRAADRVAWVVITLGGIGTIISVLMVCVFLMWIALPLFSAVHIHEAKQIDIAAERRLIELREDISKLLVYGLYDNGDLKLVRLDTGKVLLQTNLFEEERRLTAWSFSEDGSRAVFGFDDGTLQLARIAFEQNYPQPNTLPDEVRDIGPGEVAEWEEGLVYLTPQMQHLHVRVAREMEPPIEAEDPQAVVLIDHVTRATGPIFAYMTQDGRLAMASVRIRRNIMTRETTYSKDVVELPFDITARGLPKFVRMTGLGDNLYLIWEDGYLERYDMRDPSNAQVVETLDLVDEPGATITTVTYLLGRQTLITGDSTGRVRGWFRVKPADAGTADGALLVAAHEMLPGSDAVQHIAVSARSRNIAVLFRSGKVRLYYVTTNDALADIEVDQSTAALGSAMVTLAPRDDGMVVMSTDGMISWRFDMRHPAATVNGLFRKVWYEGYSEPAHVWQSTGGTDDFEVKYGLYPLVFGTLKATFYSLMFAVPIALLAALFTSEFLGPNARATIKPTIEIMASLPSVVLGFLAALVIAPFAEHVVPAILACAFTLPLSFLLSAYVWQMLPKRVALRLNSWRLAFCCLVIPVAVAMALPVGALMELVFFGGNIKSWLDGQSGGATGGWMLFLLPVTALVMTFLSGRYINPWMMNRFAHLGLAQFARMDLVKFLIVVALAVVSAWMLSGLLALMGLDPRGVLLGTYVQRNALIVGFVMGFAVIPIIYTIADDALTTVPDHLRSAALAAGATPWQMAMTVVIPTAMSGLFSAVMVGLGRAVGETMIVLMAAGNTPVMEMNPFNGFRTLSANIAVELPEAVRDSTHYRILFLAALLLFMMTFVVNTVAELIRLRFRKRAYQL